MGVDEKRVKKSLTSGVLGAALTASGTTITFASDPGLATLGDDEIAVLVLGGVEIVHLTAYVATQTTGTIARGQDGTSQAAHASGARWVHAPSHVDFKFPRAVRNLSADTTLNDWDWMALVSAPTVDVTITLPDPTTVPGQEYVLFAVDASNTITVAPAAGTIDGLSEIDLLRDSDVLFIVSDGTEYKSFIGFGDPLEVDDGDSGAADTIDWSASPYHKSDLTDSVVYSFTDPAGASKLVLRLVQDPTGSRTVTWPASVKWAGGSAPTLTTTPGAEDIIEFYYDESSYHGTVISLDSN